MLPGMPEVVHAEVTGDTYCEGQEFSLFRIAIAFDRADDFEEGFLKDIFCQVLVLHQHVDGGIDLVFVAADNCFKAGIVAILVQRDQGCIAALLYSVHTSGCFDLICSW